MFYFSRAEQVVLFALLVLLLAGAGVLTYARGRRAQHASATSPLLLEAPRPAVAGAGEEAEEQGASVESEGSGVVEQGSVPGSSPQTGSDVTRSEQRISLNSATAEELQRLPGIGPVFARRIVEYREQLKQERGYGFESVDELLNVSGIGPRRLAAVKNLVKL